MAALPAPSGPGLGQLLVCCLLLPPLVPSLPTLPLGAPLVTPPHIPLRQNHILLTFETHHLSHRKGSFWEAYSTKLIAGDGRGGAGGKRLDTA